MSRIKVMQIVIITADRAHADTSGQVYLGICGREFRLHPNANNPARFTRGGQADFILGDGGNHESSSGVANKEKNDPTLHGLFFEDLSRYPVYVRLEGNDHWMVHKVTLKLWDSQASFFNTSSDFPDLAPGQVYDRVGQVEYAVYPRFVAPSVVSSPLRLTELAMKDNRDPQPVVWLGPESGRFCYLTRTYRLAPIPARILENTRRRTAGATKKISRWLHLGRR